MEKLNLCAIRLKNYRFFQSCFSILLFILYYCCTLNTYLALQFQVICHQNRRECSSNKALRVLVFHLRSFLGRRWDKSKKIPLIRLLRCLMMIPLLFGWR